MVHERGKLVFTIPFNLRHAEGDFDEAHDLARLAYVHIGRSTVLCSSLDSFLEHPIFFIFLLINASLTKFSPLQRLAPLQWKG
jgi:hypothetical protein